MQQEVIDHHALAGRRVGQRHVDQPQPARWLEDFDVRPAHQIAGDAHPETAALARVHARLRRVPVRQALRLGQRLPHLLDAGTDVYPVRITACALRHRLTAHSQEPPLPAARLPRSRSATTRNGSSETAITSNVTTLKLFLTQGRLPKAKPPNRNSATHETPPAILKAWKRRYGMRPMPGTNGGEGRTI